MSIFLDGERFHERDAYDINRPNRNEVSRDFSPRSALLVVGFGILAVIAWAIFFGAWLIALIWQPLIAVAFVFLVFFAPVFEYIYRKIHDRFWPPPPPREEKGEKKRTKNKWCPICKRATRCRISRAIGMGAWIHVMRG